MLFRVLLKHCYQAPSQEYWQNTNNRNIVQVKPLYDGGNSGRNMYLINNVIKAYFTGVRSLTYYVNLNIPLKHGYCKMSVQNLIIWAAPWLRGLVKGVTAERPSFCPSSVQCWFCGGRNGTGEVFPVKIMYELHHTLIHSPATSFVKSH